MARWSTGGKSAWPRRVRPASVTIARAVAAVAAVRAAAALAVVVAAAGRAAVTEIETAVEIAARVATTDKQNNSSAGQKTGATFFLGEESSPDGKIAGNLNKKRVSLAQAALANLRTHVSSWEGLAIWLSLAFISAELRS